MAQSITNLTADWMPSTGINLQWTAASDATNGSTYEIYVLGDVISTTPIWNLVGTGSPYVVSSSFPGTAVPVTLQVVAPATFFTFPISMMTALQGAGSTIAPDSFAFLIIHIDNMGTPSAAASISVFQNAINQPYGTPHFQNSISLDSFGQFKTNPQDSYDEIAAGVAVFMGTLPGQRTMIPDYGVDDLPFSQLNMIQISNDLNFWEDRANAILSAQVDDYDNAILSVKIQGGQGGAQ